MKEIKENEIMKFIDYYHHFHDSNIIELKKENDFIELKLFVFWSGKPIINEDKLINTNKTEIKIIFKDINNFNYNENILYDEINNISIKNIKINENNYIEFILYDMMNDIIINITSSNITYEEIK